MYTVVEKPASKTIEVTVISAEGLMENKRRPVKKNSFIIVKIDPFNSRSTGLDREGGCYPAWNEKLEMELPLHARLITVEAHSGPKIIGSAQVPVSDFMGGFLPSNYLSFLSYRLRDANGEKNGIVNLSVKVKGSTANNTSCSSSSSRPSMGVPVDRIVMGVPLRPCGVYPSENSVISHRSWPQYNFGYVSNYHNTR